MNWKAVALVVLAFSACSKSYSPQSQETRQVLESFSMDQSTLGKKSWNLKAEAATLDENGQEAWLAKPRMEIYKDNKPVTGVSSASGRLDTGTYDLRLSSGVKVVSAEYLSTLETEELDYSSKKKKFTTDKDVLVRRRGGVLRGRGLQAAPDLSEIRIFNQKAVIKEGSL